MIEIIQAGIDMLLSYLSEHVLTCLIPAFFIAGAIAAFVSKESILKYLGVQAKKYISYSVASISGTILAV
ncbi:MAG TPA: permease, partial [Thermoplasmatales archaeon]|nr:permease [Thermoplasmatales archaeon]